MSVKSCTTCTVVSSKHKITQGSNALLVVSLKDSNTGKAFPLPDFQGATGYFVSTEDGETVAASGGLVSQDRGEVAFAMTPAVTSAMYVGEDQSWEGEVELSGMAGPLIFQILEKLTVKARIKNQA